MDVQNVIEAQEREPQLCPGESGKAFVGMDEKVGTACAKARDHKRNRTFGEW